MLQCRYYIALLIFSLSFFNIRAQEADTISAPANIVYLEALGSGGYGSLNYEHIFLRKDMLSLHIRGGISTYRLRDFELKFNPDIIIPVSAGISYGKTHGVELGIGQAFSSVSEIDLERFAPGRKNRLSALGILAYRVIFRKPSIMLRFAYTPIWEFYKSWQHWGGVSFGYGF